MLTDVGGGGGNGLGGVTPACKNWQKKSNTFKK